MGVLKKIQKKPEGIERFQMQKKVLSSPSVDIVVVIGRPKGRWYQTLIGTIQAQNYNNFGLIEVENKDRKKTIGACLNDAIRFSDAEYLLFVGDDDFLSNDYIHSCISFLKFHRRAFGTEPIHVGSCVTWIDENDGIISQRAESPCGMWNRSWLINNPFNEELTIREDVELMERADRMKAPRVFMEFHYGYYYRQHKDQNSRQS